MIIIWKSAKSAINIKMFHRNFWKTNYGIVSNSISHSALSKKGKEALGNKTKNQAKLSSRL